MLRWHRLNVVLSTLLSGPGQATLRSSLTCLLHLSLLLPTWTTVVLCVRCLRVCSIRPGLLSAVLITETMLSVHTLDLGLSSLSVVSRNGSSGRLSVKLLGTLMLRKQLSLLLLCLLALTIPALNRARNTLLVCLRRRLPRLGARVELLTSLLMCWCVLLFRAILPSITERATPTRGMSALGVVLTNPLNASRPYAMNFLGVPPCPIPPSPPGLPLVPVMVPVPLTLHLGVLVMISFLALKFTWLVWLVTRRNLWVCR